MDEKILVAYCSMVRALSEHARTKACSDEKIHRKYYPELDSNQILYSHDFMSAFEDVADTLSRLNIMKHLDQCCSTFICDTHNEYEIAEGNWSNGPSFYQLLEILIGLFGEFGTEYYGFGTSSETFFKPKGQILASAMNALVAVGYAEAVDGSFRWTDKARPAMVAKGFWPENADDGTV